MRSIRYRIWDKKHNRWFHGSTDPQAIATQTDAISLFGETIVMGGLLSDQNEDGVWKDDPDIKSTLDIVKWLEVCEGTGVKDKNGREIFDGDVVDKAYHNGEIYDEKGLVHLGALYDSDGWNNGEILGWRAGDSSLLDVCKECEIIGNIYENPELLKEIELPEEEK